MRRKGKVVGVRTDKGGYATGCVVNAAGAWARAVAQAGGLDAPVVPDCHEAGITEAVAPSWIPWWWTSAPRRARQLLLLPAQARAGGLLHLPQPAHRRLHRRETRAYLPMIARRMVDLMPKLGNLKVRRTWRGLYPMTPDGAPLVGRSPHLEGYIDAIGMCGQGYMLGPGVGALVARSPRTSCRPGTPRSWRN